MRSVPPPRIRSSPFRWTARSSRRAAPVPQRYTSMAAILVLIHVGACFADEARLGEREIQRGRRTADDRVRACCAHGPQRPCCDRTEAELVEWVRESPLRPSCTRCLGCSFFWCRSASCCCSRSFATCTGSRRSSPPWVVIIRRIRADPLSLFAVGPGRPEVPCITVSCGPHAHRGDNWCSEHETSVTRPTLTDVSVELQGTRG